VKNGQELFIVIDFTGFYNVEGKKGSELSLLSEL
jgi:hypothetical protein